MKKIVVATLKGGTGKTTTTFNVGGCLSETNKVLLVDIDPQANLTQDCGIDITDMDLYSIKNVLDNYMDPEKVIVKSPIESLPNLDVLPSNIWLYETDMDIANRSNRERILENYFDDNKEYFAQYDYIIFDTNPSMSIINRNALFISDSIILVTDISKNGLTGLDVFQYLWNKASKDLRKEDTIKAVIINNFDAKTNVAKDLLQYCKTKENIEDLLIETVVPVAVRIKETSIINQPINIYQREKKEHEIYKNLIRNLKDKGAL